MTALRKAWLTFVIAIAVLPAASGGALGEPAEPQTPPAKGSGATPPAGARDLARLRADYDRLRDELFRSRARAQLAAEGVYASKLGAVLRWKGAPDFVLRRAEIRIDESSVWDSGEKPLVDELIRVAERPIKPGPHTLSVRLEVRPGTKADRESQDLGYVSEQTFVINVPDNRRTTVEITADDDGDLPEYEPELEVEIESEK